MVDLVQQLREVKEKKFSTESLQTMVLWGADEIERLRTTLAGETTVKTIEGLAQLVLKFYRDNLASHGVALPDFLARLANQVETESLDEE